MGSRPVTRQRENPTFWNTLTVSGMQWEIPKYRGNPLFREFAGKTLFFKLKLEKKVKSEDTNLFWNFRVFRL